MSANQLLLVLKESIAARLWHTDVADTQPVPSVDDLLDSGQVDRGNERLMKLCSYSALPRHAS